MGHRHGEFYMGIMRTISAKTGGNVWGSNMADAIVSDDETATVWSGGMARELVGDGGSGGSDVQCMLGGAEAEAEWWWGRGGGGES